MPQHLIAPPIRTERLLLRAYRRDDFRHLVAIYQTERSRYIGGPLGEMQVWQGFMNTIGHWPIMGFGAWAIELSATGACIGEVAITQPPNYPETELGWVLFGDHEGQGYALEAATAALAFARQLGSRQPRLLCRSRQSSLGPPRRAPWGCPRPRRRHAQWRSMHGVSLRFGLIRRSIFHTSSPFVV